MIDTKVLDNLSTTVKYLLNWRKAKIKLEQRYINTQVNLSKIGVNINFVDTNPYTIDFTNSEHSIYGYEVLNKERLIRIREFILLEVEQEFQERKETANKLFKEEVLKDL